MADSYLASTVPALLFRMTSVQTVRTKLLQMLSSVRGLKFFWLHVQFPSSRIHFAVIVKVLHVLLMCLTKAK